MNATYRKCVCLQCVSPRLKQKKRKTVKESRQQLRASGTNRHRRLRQDAAMITLVCAPSFGASFVSKCLGSGITAQIKQIIQFKLGSCALYVCK